MRIIPAIDIIDGKCVRLTQGDYGKKKIYNENPLEVALEFAGHGIQYLHLVDLDGAREGKVVNWKVLEKLTSKTDLKIDFGGGIKTDQDLQIAFDCGAKQITAGSIAVKDPELVTNWLETYGPEKIILGADVKQGKIAVSGWTETSDLVAEAFISNYLQKGIKYVVCTDISKDGMMEGPAFEYYADLCHTFTEMNLVASGGIRHIEDLEKLIGIGLEGAIIGKAIYEGAIALKDLKKLC
jgi:phosphoribosylformimino-5-aminoimidazole carboxamide ribotide isomerase